jgi:putative acetyltransferase
VLRIPDRAAGGLQSPVQPGAGSTSILALGPMSVAPSQSHRGIGSSLIQAAVNRARDMRYTAIVVAGHPEYYWRFDFEPASHWGISTNLPLPADAITAMELTHGAPADGGRVIYPEVFAGIFGSCA